MTNHTDQDSANTIDKKGIDKDGVEKSIGQRLRDIIEHMEHVLPGQAPIKDFVHHNTLHGYQHLHFTEALKSAHDITGTYGYMSQDEFVEYYKEGRINKTDLLAVIRNDESLAADKAWITTESRTIKLEQLYFAALLFGKNSITSSKLSWLIEEKNMLSSFMPYTPKSSRKHLLANNKDEAQAVSDLWKACLEVLCLDLDLLHPEELADLSPEFAETLFKELALDQHVESADHFMLHGEIRKESDHIRERLWKGVGKEYTLSGLLKALTGHDILDDYRPALLRHISSFLDQGVASWHQKDRQKGFFASWRASAYSDMVRHDSELPDWQDELDGLPEDSLEAVMWELDHLGLDEDQWADYIERVALELPGWSGMFLWLHQNPGYEGMTQPIDMMDYLAVRMVLERLYAQRLTRRKWQIEASLHAIQWHFHRHRSELYVRYVLYNGNLPEFLTSRANRLSIHDASFADNYEMWQKLADMIWTWQQSTLAGSATADKSATANKGARSDTEATANNSSQYSVYQHGWQLFRMMQVMGVEADTVNQLTQEQLGSFYQVLDSLDINTSGYLWLQAYEHHFSENFFNAVSQNANRGNWQARGARDKKGSQRGDAQIIFCMDDREEAFRRHLEVINPLIETFGAAAHFNVPHRWKALDNDECVKLTPVTIDPVHEVHETAVAKDKPLLAKHTKRVATRIKLENTLNHEVRRNLLSSTLMIAASAPVTLVTLAGKIFAPLTTGRLLQNLKDKIDTPINTEIHINAVETKQDATPDNPSLGYSVQEQAMRVSSFLRTNGLADGFATFVVIMGHGSTNENNPHRSAYGCGACSGKFSGPNGRIMAKMANNPKVRAVMKQDGLDIPSNCWFIGGMHNTCNEVIDWYDTDLIPVGLQPDYQKLSQQLVQAGQHSAHERCRKFASAPTNPSMKQAADHIASRALDFSQARPELGHATIACAVIGRRSVSQGLFLDRRIFLISYDSRDDDENSSLLEALLLSAGPVGAGISLEYYFSKVSNNRYGAGSKITHNVTGFFGVMEGGGSDLRTGLPKQMIEIHEAMRCQVMVEASVDTLTAIYQRSPPLQELIGNEWILLSSVDPDTGEVHSFNPKKGFIGWTNDHMPRLDTVEKSVDWYGGKMEPLEPVLLEQGGVTQVADSTQTQTGGAQ
ncbi:MAG: DUF2309 domain-containing protein [Thiotrichaceae bacterium]